MFTTCKLRKCCHFGNNSSIYPVISKPLDNVPPVPVLLQHNKVGTEIFTKMLRMLINLAKHSYTENNLEVNEQISDMGKAYLIKNNYDSSIFYLQEYNKYLMRMEGISTFKKQLSPGRVVIVEDYLAKKNVAPNRMQSMGYGEEIPLIAIDSEENRAINRRVELKVIAIN